MKTTILKLYTGFIKTKAVMVLAVAAVYMALAAQSGGSLWELALFALVLAVYIVLPGLLAARVLGTQKFAPGFTGPLAILLGSGFFAALYCVAMRLHILWLLYLLPPVLSAVWLGLAVARCAKRGQPLPAIKKPALLPHHWLLALLFSALLLFFTFYGVVKHARPLAVGDILPNHDLLWNVGNANSFKLAFPPQDIRFTGVRLHYHYLTELLAGALSLVSGISAYNIAAFYMQAFMLAALVLCLYKFGRVMWPQSLFKAMLFTYAPFLFSCASLWKILPNGWSVFNNSNITHIVTNINAQATALVFLSIFLGLLVPAMRQKYRVGPVHFVLLLCSFFMLTFAKGPLAAMVICGLAITMLIGLFQRNTGWRGLLLGVLLAGMFAAVYVTMFSSGANDSMALSYTGTLVRGYFNNIQNLIWHKNYYLWLAAVPVLWVLQAFLSMPAQFLLYLRALVRDVRHFATLAPERMLAQGVAAGGLLAYFLFDHPHFSQVYFLFAAIFFITLLAVDEIGTLRWPAAGQLPALKAKAKKLFIGVVAVCAAVAVATTGFLYVHYMGSGGRQLLRNLGLMEKYPYDVVITPDDEAAMLWLRDNSPATAMFATNRIHTGARLEGISNLYSAFCERQAYMEGFQYAKTNMGVAEDIINRRLAVNNALFSAATAPETVLQLCRENGISYLVYSTQLPGDESQLSAMELAYNSPTVRIYRLPGAA
ncbi:MAG: hypothetical protein ACK5L3_11865 [Oscillospiraceae bacterium]